MLNMSLSDILSKIRQFLHLTDIHIQDNRKAVVQNRSELG